MVRASWYLTLMVVCCVRCYAAYNCVPDIPPRAALIQVSDPDATGVATFTGQPGAVPARSRVVLWNLDTGYSAETEAAADGSFSSRLFAPLSTSTFIQAGSLTLPRRQDYLGCLPGTIIRSPEPPAPPSGVAVAGAGLVQTQFPPAWTFQGTLSGQRLQPGGSVQLAGTLSIVSTVLATAGAMDIEVVWYLEKLSGQDGKGSLGHSTMASTLLTPTGLPIERTPGRVVDYLMSNTTERLALTKRATDRAEATVSSTLTLAADLPAGFYRPFLVMKFNGVPTETTMDNIIIDGAQRAPRANRSGHSLRLPIIQVGSPAAPRLYWSLLSDDLGGGTRGTRAAEDQNRFGLISRILTHAETFVIPRLDENARPISYRLEPFAPTVSTGVSLDLPTVPLIPFRFPSGRLTVRVQQPDGTASTLGPAPFAQSRLRGVTFPQQARSLDGGGGSLENIYQLSTVDSRFDISFPQDGRYVITLDGSIDDIWGTTWSAGGTYEVYVARPLSLDTTVLPGTPFEVGDTFNPGVVLSPPVPATVNVRVRVAPNSDAGRMVDRTVSGSANRFGYFHPQGSGILLDQQGEYRADVTASYRDAQGNLWMGSRTWGSAVASKNPGIIAHGTRGTDEYFNGPQWFFRSQSGVPIGGDHVHMAFNSGDVMWLQKSDAATPPLTFQDPSGAIPQLLQQRNLGLGFTQNEVQRGEIPLYSVRQGFIDPHIDPSRIDVWGYGYRYIERPLVRVREEIGEDGTPHAYWRFSEKYSDQIGTGSPGDLKNDIKFQYGAAVLYGPALPRAEYAIYGSLFVLVPDDDMFGTRVLPPFQANGGGPIMTLKGRAIDLFLHLTGVRPGSVLEIGDSFGLAGAVGPPLAAAISYTVTSPSGKRTDFSGRANKVGYYYRPANDFTIDEAGMYTVDLKVTYDGITSAGQVFQPFPTGDVLGTDNGRFYFYAVARDTPPLSLTLPERATTGSSPTDIVAIAPSAHVTAMMPGFQLVSRAIPGSGGRSTYRYDPASLARDFPNLDADSFGGDVVTISMFDPVAKSARIVALHGWDLLNPQPGAAPAPVVVNGASFIEQVAPGSIASLFATNLSTTVAAAAIVPLPANLGGFSATLNGRILPLFYVSPNQVNFQVPWEIPVPGPSSLIITVDGAVSPPAVIHVGSYGPGIFQSGGSQGAIINTSGQLLTSSTPARVGEVISIYATGLGPVRNQPATGAITPNALSLTATNPFVAIGGVPATVQFSGLAPGLVAVYQVNVRVPEGVPAGDAVPVNLMIGGAAAKVVTIAVQQ